MGFLSSLCCISSKHTTDTPDEKLPRRRDKPSRYNKQNLPSIIVEDPAPWVKNHGARGMSAPTENRASELTAAVTGEPSSLGFTPKTVRAVK